jgi:hypothetical protein
MHSESIIALLLPYKRRGPYSLRFPRNSITVLQYMRMAKQAPLNRYLKRRSCPCAYHYGILNNFTSRSFSLQGKSPSTH